MRSMSFYLWMGFVTWLFSPITIDPFRLNINYNKISYDKINYIKISNNSINYVEVIFY